MKNALLLLLIYISIVFISTAQTPQFQWVKQFSGVSTMGGIGRSITVDSSGNVYTTGQFNGTFDFDPGNGVFKLTAVGDNDIFISKLDPIGNFLWAKNIGGYSGDIGFSITVDRFNNLYLLGNINETASTNSPGNIDVFVAKFDSNGNVLWRKIFGGYSWDSGSSLSIDNSGYVYITGFFSGTVNFDTSSVKHILTSKGSDDIFILKLDPLGNFVWVKSIGGVEQDNGSSVVVDAMNNVYTTGYFAGTLDFDPGDSVYNLTSAGGVDIFITKFDSLGNFIWAKRIGSNSISRDEASSIALDLYNNVFITGNSDDYVDFDPGIGEYYIKSMKTNVFILKLDTDGNFKWVKAMNNSSSDFYNIGLRIDSKGDIYTSGSFKGTIDFNPDENVFYNLTAVKNTDIFISKLDTAGKFLWAGSMGGVGNEYAYSIVSNIFGDVYVTGTFRLTVDFNPGDPVYNLTESGNGSIFVVKLSQNSSDVNELHESNTNLAIYPNPVNTIATVSFGKIISNGRCKLINIIGQTVMEHGDIHGSSYPLDISTLAEGFYIVEVWDKSMVSRIPLVKH